MWLIKQYTELITFIWGTLSTHEAALGVTRLCAIVLFALSTQKQAHALTWATWSCTRPAGSIECFPSGRGPSRRSCHRCGRSWRSRSWWRLCLGSAARWGRTHRTAPCVPPPWGWGHGRRLSRHTRTRKHLHKGDVFPDDSCLLCYLFKHRHVPLIGLSLKHVANTVQAQIVFN